jgi:uncharacterized protein YkwD
MALVVALVALFAPSASAMDLERLIAPTAVCPDQTDPAASKAAQEQAMQCMSDFARERAGLASFGEAESLDRSARDKAADILRCNSFSHYACGREVTYWMVRVGYIPAQCWRAGENIAWGSGARGDVRSIFRAWIHSPEHRENILGPYSELGVGLAVGTLGDHAGAHVWTQHFGSHCGDPSSAPAAGLAAVASRHAVR